jgi:hypothetical protein
MRASLKMTTGLIAAGVALAGLAVLAEPAEAKKQSPCPKGWVMGPQGCQPGSLTATPKGGGVKASKRKKPAKISQ